jgi:P27 family predicted phage terminase small subunit
MWGRLAPKLCELGLLQAHTIDAFAAYCQCWAQWQEAVQQVRVEGLVIQTGRGMTRINPAASYAAEMSKQVRAYAAEFGLTPASRGRAGAAPQTDATDTAMDEFLEVS